MTDKPVTTPIDLQIVREACQYADQMADAEDRVALDAFERLEEYIKELSK